MKVSKMIIIAGLVLLILALFSYFIPILVSNAKPSSTSASILISGENVTVDVPVVLDENGKVLEMFGKPGIKGTASANIIDTEYGKALRITGSGAIEISMNQKGDLLLFNQEANEKFVNGFTLSTSNVTSYGQSSGSFDVWVYSEENGTALSFSVKRDNGWGREISIGTKGEEKLIKGWQVINLPARSLWYD